VNRLVTHLVDGQPNDSLPVTNRGLAYGDGVFETILFNKLEPVLWHEHLERMSHACEVLGLNLPNDVGPEWLRLCVQLLEQSQQNKAVIKIMIIRGSGERGYRSLPDATMHSIISMHPAPEPAPDSYVEGMKLWVCESRLSRNPLLAGMKHLNRLEQVMASREWPDDSFHEGLMLDVAGNVIECTRSNIFFVQDNDDLVTPALDYAGVAGVMRGFLINHAQRLNLSVTTKTLTLQDIGQVREVFVCNSVVGIYPVAKLCLNRDEVICWPPGRVTRSLQESILTELNTGMHL